MLRWLGELVGEAIVGAVVLAAIWLPLWWLATLLRDAPISEIRIAGYGVLLLTGWLATDWVRAGR